MMSKTLSISLFILMALVAAHGLPSPAITKESLRSKLTPSMTLVFQSLHKAAAAIKDSQKERSDSIPLNRWAGRQESVVSDITKDKSVRVSTMAVPKETLEDWSVVQTGGVFGDTESGRLPHIVMMPIVAL